MCAKFCVTNSRANSTKLSSALVWQLCSGHWPSGAELRKSSPRAAIRNDRLLLLRALSHLDEEPARPGLQLEETCSASNAPFITLLSDSQLEFDVPDSRLPELALCNVVQNSSFGELACVLQVSIVDTVFLLHVAVAVTLELRRGAALAFMPGAHTYVPLLAFHAEVQLAYMDASAGFRAGIL